MANPTSDARTDDALLQTPLHALHVELGAKMVPFAGYDMPVQYPAGVLKEHLHTRAKAGLFDVSHMGQAVISGPGHDATAKAIEALVPADICSLAPSRIRYTQLLNDDGGIIDDLMVSRSASRDDDGRLMLVVNAGRKVLDYAHIAERLADGLRLELIEDHALLALQGPAAVAVLSTLCPPAAELGFMATGRLQIGDVDCQVSRSGYTGEDGFEISVPSTHAEAVARTLLAHADVEPIGLGARDSLRLEAGLCLYGHDIDETTSPIEAVLQWSIQKRRRQEGGFPGFDRIARELADGPDRKRVGIRPDGRAPAREGTEICNTNGAVIGTVTSGGFGPSVGGPIAMGYITRAAADVDTAVHLMVRGKALPARIVAMPFTPHRYFR